MAYHRPTGNVSFSGRRHITEEEIRYIALEDDHFRAARKDARKHTNRALEDSNDGQHGRNAEGYSGDADRTADFMPQEIDQNQPKEDHRFLSIGIAPVPSMIRFNSSFKVARNSRRNDRDGRISIKSFRFRSPRNNSRSRRLSDAPTPMARTMFGRSRDSSRAVVLPDVEELSRMSLRSSTIW